MKQTIKPNQDFRHSGKSYRKGRKYEVESDDAEYFETCGWVGEQTAGESASLKIQDIELGHSSEVN